MKRKYKRLHTAKKFLLKHQINKPIMKTGVETCKIVLKPEVRQKVIDFLC